MKFSNIKYGMFAAILALGITSCEDFLDRPTEDSYNTDNYYQTDDQCIAGVNYLYNSPWYDFQRGFIKVGEVLSGNYYWGSSPYLTFTVNGTDEDLVNMSYSLWAVIGHANTVYNSIQGSPASASVKNQCMGECLAWKAIAYFYLVRSFGDVPIVHDNTADLVSGSYNEKYKIQKADVYEYIIMTLEKAMELLPKSRSEGRIDYYCAEGLLAKVYLTKAGVSGSLDAADLAKAADYAKDVIDNSGRSLLNNYSDVFRLANNKSQESLIAWRWTASGNVWTAQNTLQSDLAIEGFDEFGDCWGGWAGMSVDLQEAFGVKLLEQTPDAWVNGPDSRRKATMMLAGDKYSYFWADKGGFDYIKFIYDTDFNAAATGSLQSSTGSNSVKHLYGNAQDHVNGTGVSAAYMYSSLATHLLRLSDVYLIYAEAKMGTAKTTTDADAIDAFYTVRHRANATYERPSSITWEDVWKERRLELAMEGDRWFDYVRVSYYNSQFCINELTSQKRNYFNGLNDLYKGYSETGSWSVDTASMSYDTTTSAPNVTVSSFTLPFPTEDVVFNPHLMEDPVHVDVRSEYSY
ncbi:RagB/SusD family nutrient uptake outer membrane protein [uncultured Bacteroides sp.]|uniref:RagB/SusD family nutrient uptake outer membrane protein n=1 Tax=uncultured Bacteroides sp. TaxID=162156 RepID=UPI00259A1457|nr:RagB/SusD family nutrient uptake outer membrane protein [uncultured Bacteroides sp.]